MSLQIRRTTHLVWVILSGLGLGGLLFGVLILSVIYTKPGEAALGNPTAVVTIVAAPTSTPLGSQNLLFTPTPTQEQPSVVIDGITLGRYVQITGTGGDGLRLRKEPGIGAPVLFLGYESEVFKVNDGPIEADEFFWWFLTAPYDENRSGWAAATFVTAIDIEPSQ